MLIKKIRSRVLLIDDDSLAAELIRHMLGDSADISLRYVSDARQAQAAAAEFKPTVVLVDLMMPLIDGFRLIRQFRAEAETEDIPIILLSSEDGPEQKVQGFAEGANDYLVKWPNKLELAARVRYHSSAYLAHRERDDAFVSLRESQAALLERTRQLEESQAALHHAQKMEAVGKLTGGVAHDFNNVLQIIGGNLQLLKYDTADNEAAQRRIAAATQGVARGARLAAQLLAFGRRQPLQPTVIHIGALLRSMDDMLRRAVGSGVQIELAVPSDAWNTLADASQLENVLLNLAINARDAIGEKGRLRIEAANVTLDRQEAAALGLDGSEFLSLSVIDNGEGMPPEVAERAFEPFFTTKPNGQGTGLGLSMAYGFIKQTGGHIEIDSVPGSGTTIRALLPKACEPLREPQPMTNRPMTGGKERILVVEDEPDVRTATSELLSSLGYQVLQAENAHVALTLLEGGEKVDLIFTDVVMPGPLRSAELAQRAQVLLPGVQVLFTSGYTENGIVHQGRLDPGVSLLRKPYTEESLAQKIRQLICSDSDVKDSAGSVG